MAQNKASKESPRIFTGTDDPNDLKIVATKVGDLFVDTTALQLYFACSLTNWGTCGTAGS
jgi:hypothetical protein